MSVAALIRDGVVVNVAAFDPVSSSGWLEAVTPEFDEVRVVNEAGIGWTVEADGLRPPSPFASWTWDGAAWQPPVAKPDGDHVWDEADQVWVPVA